MSDLLFYRNLPAMHHALRDMLTEPDVFLPVPSSWDVIITDIKGSTKAVTEGRFREVNTIAASCVIACLNIAKQREVQIAFLYGGDGVTLLVPSSLTAEMTQALSILQANTLASSGLPLRVGSISVEKIYAAGRTVRVAKWSVAPGYDQAVFLGDGLAYADKAIKADMASTDTSDEPRPVDLSGLMCRWNEIKPAKRVEEVVCAIVQATHVKEQASVYHRVLEIFDETYGSYEQRHPVTMRALRPSVAPKQIGLKSRLSRNGSLFVSFVREYARAIVSSFLFRFSVRVGRFDPTKYLQDLIAATDTLHLSGTLYTVMKGTSDQRIALRAALDHLEQEGKLIYGISICPASVVTCYVPRYDMGHVHFLDGANGGYTRASQEFKAKVK